jgi:glutamyl-tRNA reductase
MLLLPIAPRMPRFTVRPSVRDERQPVRIAIIGTGKMGRGFAQALAPTHEVVIASRDPDWAAAIAVKTGGATYAGCG